jgi:hypothetical protein
VKERRKEQSGLLTATTATASSTSYPTSSTSYSWTPRFFICRVRSRTTTSFPGSVTRGVAGPATIVPRVNHGADRGISRALGLPLIPPISLINASPEGAQVIAKCECPIKAPPGRRQRDVGAPAMQATPDSSYEGRPWAPPRNAEYIFLLTGASAMAARGLAGRGGERGGRRLERPIMEFEGPRTWLALKVSRK